MNTWQLKTVWLGIALWCQASVSGQQFAYKQYDITDGLVGNHVYHAVQDKDGFMWFATETGLSRFDGTQFKNFNTEQGLPDNEIVRLFADSKGRVWIIPFKPTLSYYYQGKIYNARSDSVLKNLQLTEPVKAVVEDNYHNIILHCERILYILHPNGHISSVRQYDGAPIVISSIGCDALSRPYIMANVTDKGQSIFTCLRLHTYPRLALTIVAVQGQKELIHSIAEEHLGIFQRGIVMPMEQFLNKKPITQLHCWDMQSARKDTLPIPVGFNRLSFNSKGLVFINGSNGVNTYDFEHPGTTTNFLPGQNVSCTMDDTEGNRWFTTLGNGVFRLLSPEVKKIDLGINPFSVTALCKSGNRMVVAGDRDDRVYTVDFQTGTALQGHALPKGISNKVLGIVSEGGKLWFLLTWTFVAADSQCKSIRLVPAMIRHGLSYKDAVPLGNNRFLFATHISAMIIDGDQTGPSALQTVFAGRSTAVCVAYGDMYIGTLQGLYRIDTAQRSTYLGNGMPLLASRITKLLFAADRLWVGTNDNGVICYDGQKIIKKISVKTGLVGNIVRALHANGRYLWVGTDMGLNKIDMGDTSLPIVAQYTAADGLASDMVNAVYVSQNRVYVGTPAGLNFFDETKMSNQSHCNLQIVSITVSGRERSLDAGRLYLHNQENDIRFNFVGISYKSGGHIGYQYRLLGIDEEWRNTRDNFLQYQALPSGTYVLQLRAINRFGVKSQVREIPFTIQKKLVEENWFRLTVLLAAVALAWAIAHWRIRRIRRRYREKIQTNQRIALLEQQALKAQMNPHFIFNCLNSIQQYVMDKDVMGANKFITGFSRLIRQTLENSSKQLISVGEEEAFLNAYLALEKMRFEDRFDYNVQVDPAISKEEVFLPAMLLQPYVENSIRHGIRLKKGSKGQININLSLADNRLNCEVVDNGVGREVARQYKSNQHIEYQSRGMLLTSQRIALININAKHDIALQVEDMKDAQGMAMGTKVTISLPI